MPREVRECGSNSRGYAQEPSMFFNHLDRHPVSWEGSGVSSSSLSLLFTTCSEHNVDLGTLFNHYSTNKPVMRGDKFHEFCMACQFFARPKDADGFFQLALGSTYRPAVKLSADRFVAALTRVFEKMAATRGLNPAHACTVLVRDHIAPHYVTKFGKELECGSHAAAYGYGGPMAMYPRKGETNYHRTAAAVTPYSRTHGGKRNQGSMSDQHQHGISGLDKRSEYVAARMGESRRFLAGR